MRNLKTTLALVALLGSLAVAGCGGDDSSSTATDSTSTTSTTSSTSSTSTDAASGDYASQLTTVLTDFGTSFSSLGSKLQGAKDPAALSSGIGDLESQIQTTIDDLNALEPPAEAQQGQDQMVAAFEAFSAKLSDVGDAVDSGDKAAAKSTAKDLQAAASSFQADFSAGLQQITQAGVQVQPPSGG